MIDTEHPALLDDDLCDIESWLEHTWMLAAIISGCFDYKSPLALVHGFKACNKAVGTSCLYLHKGEIEAVLSNNVDLSAFYAVISFDYPVALFCKVSADAFLTELSCFALSHGAFSGRSSCGPQIHRTPPAFHSGASYRIPYAVQRHTEDIFQRAPSYSGHGTPSQGPKPQI